MNEEPKSGYVEVNGKYYKILQQKYFDVDGAYYKIVKTEDFYIGYGISPKGDLFVVPAGGIRAEGTVISERMFLNKFEEKKRHQQPKEVTGVKNASRLVIPACH